MVAILAFNPQPFARASLKLVAHTLFGSSAELKN
jgi:hypothetical protein